MFYTEVEVSLVIDHVEGLMLGWCIQLCNVTRLKSLIAR